MMNMIRRLFGGTSGPGPVVKPEPVSKVEHLIREYHSSAKQNFSPLHYACLAELAELGDVSALPHILARITELPPSHDHISRKSIAIARFGVAAVPHLVDTLRQGIACVPGVDPFAPGVLPENCDVRNANIGWCVAKVASLAPYPELAFPLARYVYVYSWRGDTDHHAMHAFRTLGNASLEPLAEFLKSAHRERRECGAKYIKALGSGEAMSVLREFRRASGPGDAETAEQVESTATSVRARETLLSYATNVLARQTFETMAGLVSSDPLRWLETDVPGIRYQLNWYFGDKDIVHSEVVHEDAPYAVHAYFMPDLPVLGIPRP